MTTSPVGLRGPTVIYGHASRDPLSPPPLSHLSSILPVGRRTVMLNAATLPTLGAVSTAPLACSTRAFQSATVVSSISYVRSYRDVPWRQRQARAPRRLGINMLWQ